MQLLYFWVDDYRCFKNIGFNFSPRHRFEYITENRTIKYWQNDESIEGFFKEDKKGVDNLTLVIGNNGAGKTTLLNFILKSFTIENTLIEGIFIFLDDNKIKIYYNIPYKNEGKDVYLETYEIWIGYFSEKVWYKQSLVGKVSRNLVRYNMQNLECFIGHNDKALDKCIIDLQKTHFVFYSNIFTDKYSQLVKAKGVSNISTMGLIESDMNYEYEMGFINLDKNPNVNFFKNEFLRQIQFVYNYKNFNDHIPFNLPKYAYVEFADLQPTMNKIYRSLDNKYNMSMVKKYIDENSESKDVKKTLLCNILKVDNFMKNFTQEQDRSQTLPTDEVNVCYFGTKLIRGIFTGFLFSIMPSTIGGNNTDRYDAINSDIKLRILDNINLIKSLDDLFEALLCFCKNTPEKSNTNSNTQCMNSIIKFKDYMSPEFMKRISYNSLTGIFRLKVNQDNNENRKMNDLKTFFGFYKNTVCEFNYLEFSWPMSTGEYSFLSLFARFYSLIFEQKIDKINEDIIILIDEGDLTLHPKWQQKYIKFLLTYFQSIYESYNLQLVITTHSPILLSDIPASNVLYLNRDHNKMLKIGNENSNTFGANIYDIYRNGFSLNRSNFGIIGEFALDKIKKIEDILKEISEDNNHYSIDDAKPSLEYCRKIINIIGEEFIKGILQAKYDKVLNMLYKKRKEKSNSKNLDEIKNDFEKLSNEDQKALIKYIIQRNEG